MIAMEKHESTSGHWPILFFDGDCALCNFCIRFLMQIDSKKKLCFASLQGQTAKKYLSSQLYTQLDSVVFLKKQKVYLRTKATIAALKEIGGYWRIIAYLLDLCPSPLSDGLYNSIAKARYRFHLQSFRVNRESRKSYLTQVLP